jgi:heptosyltransferase-2
VKRILIVNPFGIGDVLFSTPLVKAIKKKYPVSEITYVCNRRAHGILMANPRISKLHVFEKDEYRKTWEVSKVRALRDIYRFLRLLKKEKFDIVFDASLGYMASLLMAVIVGIPVRVGFNYRKRGKFLTHKLNIRGFNDKHAIDYYLGLGDLLGLGIDDKEMELFVCDADKAWARGFLASNGISDKDEICGVIPGCGASWGKDANYRRWSPWKFAEIADHVVEKYGYKTLVFGEGSESSICVDVVSKMKNHGIQVCGKTTIGQLAALLDRCDLILTNDGGPAHMSVALRKNVVAIFGPVDEKIYGPYPKNARHVAITGHVPCRPCYRNFKYSKCATFDCLKNIRPKDVITAVDDLLKEKACVK